MTTTIEASSIIERSVAAVFSFVADDHFENHPRWDTSIVEVRTDSTPVKVGKEATIVRRTGPRTAEESCRVTAYEAPHTATFTSSFNGVTVAVETRVSELTPLRTRLALKAEVNAAGRGRLLRPLLVRMLRRNLPRSAHEIKRLLEAERQAS